MKLDRNLPQRGQVRRGKYALVKMRQLALLEAKSDYSATSSVEALAQRGIVDYGDSAETDFFVIRLKDQFAAPALRAYQEAVFREANRVLRESSLNDKMKRHQDLAEYGWEIAELVELAETSRTKRIPD